MEVELKDIVAWGATAGAILAQFFQMKGRVAVLETKLQMQSKHHDEALKQITRQLERIERKMDEKADK